MARAMSLMVLAILLVVTSGCSYLFYPRAGDYAAQAKGATGGDIYAVAAGGGIVRIGVSKRLLTPGPQVDAGLNRIQNDLGVLHPREVEILCEVLDELLHSNVPITPQRDLVDFQPKPRAGHRSEE